MKTKAITFNLEDINATEERKLEKEIAFLDEMGVEHHLNQFQIEVISNKESITIPVRLHLGTMDTIYYTCNCGEMIKAYLDQRDENNFTETCKYIVLNIINHWKHHCRTRKSTAQLIEECNDEGNGLIARVISEEFAKLREALSRK